jgi:hypothetical protein
LFNEARSPKNVDHAGIYEAGFREDRHIHDAAHPGRIEIFSRFIKIDGQAPSAKAVVVKEFLPVRAKGRSEGCRKEGAHVEFTRMAVYPADKLPTALSRGAVFKWP